MAKPETEKCPHCSRIYRRLNSHLPYCRLNPDYEKKKTVRSKNDNDLESYVEQKLMGELDPEAKGKSVKETEPKKKAAKPKRKALGKFIVDYWLTNLHGAEIGIFQKERMMARSRQFPKNMDLCGSVKQNNETIGYLGFMKKDWEEQEENPCKKRLIIKWFDSDSISWKGTIEEMVLTSLAASIGTDDSLPTFKLMLQKYPYVVDLAKEHLGWPSRWFGEVLMCPLLIDAKNKIWEVFRFDEDVLSIGKDFDVIRITDNKLVAHIDEKVVNIGGKYVIKFYDEQAWENDNLQNVVLLFTMALKFLDPIKNKLKRTRKMLTEGKILLDISAQEEKLYRNPRALKR